MTDGNLQNIRNRAEFAQILQVQIVSGVHPQSDFLRLLRSDCVPLKHYFTAVSGGVRFGVQLNPISPDLLRAFYISLRMTLVRTRVNGAAMRPGLDTGLRRFNDTWNSYDARISQKRDLVEVHTEFGHVA